MKRIQIRFILLISEKNFFAKRAHPRSVPSSELALTAPSLASECVSLPQIRGGGGGTLACG
jgi:hypothetical protein